jgi:hypothetical protein
MPRSSSCSMLVVSFSLSMLVISRCRPFVVVAASAPPWAQYYAESILQWQFLLRGRRVRHAFIMGGKLAGAHAEQAQPALQRHAAQAFRCRAPDRRGVGRRIGQAEVARHGAKVLETQLDADGACPVALAPEVFGDLCAKLGEYRRQGIAVKAGMEIALESGFAADRARLRMRDDRPLVDSARGGVKPGGIARAKMLLQPRGIGRRQFGDRGNAQAGQLFGGTRADAIDLARGQRPDAGLDVLSFEQGQSIRLIEVGGDFREQLVGADADRATETRGVAYRLLDAAGERRAVLGQLA